MSLLYNALFLFYLLASEGRGRDHVMQTYSPLSGISQPLTFPSELLMALSVAVPATAKLSSQQQSSQRQFPATWTGILSGMTSCSSW